MPAKSANSGRRSPGAEVSGAVFLLSVESYRRPVSSQNGLLRGSARWPESASPRRFWPSRRPGTAVIPDDGPPICRKLECSGREHETEHDG